MPVRATLPNLTPLCVVATACQTNSIVLYREPAAVIDYQDWQLPSPTSPWSFVGDTGAVAGNNTWRVHADGDAILSLDAPATVSSNAALSGLLGRVGISTDAANTGALRVGCQVKAERSGAGVVFGFLDLRNFFFLGAYLRYPTPCSTPSVQQW